VNTTTTKWIDVDKLAPLGDAEIWPLARAEYLRMLSLLRSLDEGEWPRPHLDQLERPPTFGAVA
jgi:hypothetical protein